MVSGSPKPSSSQDITTGAARKEALGQGTTCEEATRREAAWRALETVTDPEVPVLTVIDMGIIADLGFERDGLIVSVTPTFAGCPALDIIRQGIHDALTAAGEKSVTVNIVYDPPWTSDRLTEEGRRKLKEFGVAPPNRNACPGHGSDGQPSDASSVCSSSPTGSEFDSVPCPLCDSTNTDLESIFGPTLCRSIHYCNDCLQSFEHFKVV